MLSPAVIAALALAPAAAQAGELRIKVVDSSGKAVADAVVTLRPQGAAAPRPRPLAGFRITQKDTQFHPFVSIAPEGTTAVFSNLDPFRHHVYSFSPAKRFELKLFGKLESRSVTFDHAGVVAIGCNIHDSMSAFIYVTDTIWTAKTGTDGIAVFRDTPDRAYIQQVWHPYLRAPGSTLQVLRQPGPDRSEMVNVRLRMAPMHMMDGY